MPQGPSSLIAADIAQGNCILYWAPAPFASFSAARSSTKWRRFGLMNNAVTFGLDKSFQEFYSGYPSTLVQRYVDNQTVSIQGEALEVNPRSVARALGGLTITETVKSSSPSATTVAASSTKSVVNLASATGYKANDEIRVGNAGNYQYGRIKSLAGAAATLWEDLDGDTNPTTGEAVAKIDTTKYSIGGVALPTNIAVKLSYTHTGGYGSLDLVIPTAQMSGTLSMAFADNSQNGTPIGLPINIVAISDATVESGNLCEFGWTHT